MRSVWARLSACVDTASTVVHVARVAMHIAVANVVAMHLAIAFAGWVAVAHAVATHCAASPQNRRAIIDIAALVIAAHVTARMAGARALALHEAVVLASHIAIRNAATRKVAVIATGGSAVVQRLAGGDTVVATLKPTTAIMAVMVAP